MGHDRSRSRYLIQYRSEGHDAELEQEILCDGGCEGTLKRFFIGDALLDSDNDSFLKHVTMNIMLRTFSQVRVFRKAFLKTAESSAIRLTDTT